MTDWLSLYALACTSWCVIGFWLRWSSLRVLRHSQSIVASKSLISAPPPQSLRAACSATFTRPWTTFHRKTDRLWAVGYACYHWAIAMLVIGYVTSLVIVVANIAHGHVIPDYFTQDPNVTNTSMGNLITWIFGNADKSASQFLFGRFATTFRAVAWLELPLALVGNTCLLAVVIRARVGAIRRGLDSASTQVRHAGRFSGQHLLVRITILTIIALEFVGRFDGYKSAARYHGAVAFTLIALVPLTYLTHIPLAPVVIWQAIGRRRRNRVV